MDDVDGMLASNKMHWTESTIAQNPGDCNLIHMPLCLGRGLSAVAMGQTVSSRKLTNHSQSLDFPTGGDASRTGCTKVKKIEKK